MNSVGTRAVSIAVAIPILVGAVLLGTWAVGIVFLGIYFLAAREVQGLTAALGGRPILALPVLGVLFLFLGYADMHALFMPATFVLLLAAALAIMVMGETVGAALGFLLTLWIAWPLGTALVLRRMGPLVLLGALALVWTNDIVAYLVGSAIGRRRLVPLVSPGKTWEGSVAGFLATVGVAVLAAPWFHASIEAAAGLGAVTAIFGQGGDLFESSLKRNAKVKDSGTFLPGHGGVLDRMDAVLFGVIAVYYYLTGVLGH